MRNNVFGCSLLFSVLVSGCSLQSAVNHIPLNTNKPQNLMVFFDGTANDERNRTNIAKLSNLLTHRNRSDIATSYISGMNAGKVIGMTSAWEASVIEAYRYLVENYDPIENNKIWIFGFSRGAFEL